MSGALEKVLRLAGDGNGRAEPEPGDDIRALVQAAHLALSEACETTDPGQAAELVYAAAGIVESLSGMFFTEGMPDWVEATAGPLDGAFGLAGVSEPYGSVTYADTGVRGDKKRYPVDTEAHTRSAWGYINKASNAAKYTASQLATIKGKIKSAMKKFGIGRNVEASASVDGDLPVLAMIRDGGATVFLAAPPPGGIPMMHAPFSGRHNHAHAVGMVHDHEHEHRADNQHGGQMHGKNSKQRSWAAEGQSDHGGGY